VIAVHREHGAFYALWRPQVVSLTTNAGNEKLDGFAKFGQIPAKIGMNGGRLDNHVGIHPPPSSDPAIQLCLGQTVPVGDMFGRLRSP
jgi:hypothetical protein